MIWSVSIAECAPPMNGKMTWGNYGKLDITCWLSWRPEDDISASYNSMVTIATLGVAVVSFGLAAKVVLAARKISPAIAVRIQITVKRTLKTKREEMDRLTETEFISPLN